MSEKFNDDDKQDLLKRGFSQENISYLESLDSDDKKPLYLKITEVMDDGITPEQIMEKVKGVIQNINNNDSQPQAEVVKEEEVITPQTEVVNEEEVIKPQTEVVKKEEIITPQQEVIKEDQVIIPKTEVVKEEVSQEGGKTLKNRNKKRNKKSKKNKSSRKGKKCKKSRKGCKPIKNKKSRYHK
jgi:hypothetical protein